MSARGKVSKKKAVSKSARSGLVFPVGRILRHFKTANSKTCAYRISIGSAVYSAAVLEYLAAEIMELAGGAAKTMKRKVITPRHVMLAIEGDREMKQVISDVIIPSCGRPLHQHVCLFRATKAKTAGKSGKRATPRVGGWPMRINTTAATAKKLTGKAAAAAASRPIKNLPFKGRSQQQPGGDSTSNGIQIFNTPVANPNEVRILNEKTLSLGQKLTVVQGDITMLPGEAIVHPTGSNFQFHGMVGNRIATVGGQEQKAVVDLLRANRPSIKTSEAVICEAKNIPYSHIIHVNSPTWSGGSSNNSDGASKALEDAISNILTLADTMNLKSVSIPSIGSGRAGYPKQFAAQTILRTIKEYFASAMQSSIRQVYFVLYDLESVNVYTSELGRLD